MKSDYLLKKSTVALSAFALIIFFLAVPIFFNLFGIRESEGNDVLFVVMANCMGALLYFAATYGFWYKK